jgi:hypothetical protein
MFVLPTKKAASRYFRSASATLDIELNEYDNLHATFKQDDWYVYDSFMRVLILLDLAPPGVVIYGIGPGVCS